MYLHAHVTHVCQVVGTQLFGDNTLLNCKGNCCTFASEVWSAAVSWCPGSGAESEPWICGAISSYCRLRLPSSINSHASASQVAGIIGMHHHAQQIFEFLVEAGFLHVAQAGLKWSSCLSLQKGWDYRSESPRPADMFSFLPLTIFFQLTNIYWIFTRCQALLLFLSQFDPLLHPIHSLTSAP